MKRREFLKYLTWAPAIAAGATAAAIAPKSKLSDITDYRPTPYLTDNNNWYLVKKPRENVFNVQHRTYALGFRVTTEMLESNPPIMTNPSMIEWSR